MNLPTATVIAGAVLTAQPLANPDELAPSVQNEVDHALAVVCTNAVPDTAASANFERFFATNGMNATERAIRLVSMQRDGCWQWRGTNVTAAAVRLLLGGSPDAKPR